MLVPCVGELTLPRGASIEVNCAPCDFIESSVIFWTAREMASLDGAATELEISEMSISLQVSVRVGTGAPLRWGKTRMVCAGAFGGLTEQVDGRLAHDHIWRAAGGALERGGKGAAVRHQVAVGAAPGMAWSW
jgi:hypothetical protein